jgi:hypothetical protein
LRHCRARHDDGLLQPAGRRGSGAGTYWVNPYRPDVRPKYEIELELGAAAEAELGSALDPRAFHYHLLAAGALPLDMLEQRMRTWIASGAANRESGR